MMMKTLSATQGKISSDKKLQETGQVDKYEIYILIIRFGTAIFFDCVFSN